MLLRKGRRVFKVKTSKFVQAAVDFRLISHKPDHHWIEEGDGLYPAKCPSLVVCRADHSQDNQPQRARIASRANCTRWGTRLGWGFGKLETLSFYWAALCDGAGPCTPRFSACRCTEVRDPPSRVVSSDTSLQKCSSVHPCFRMASCLRSI